MLAGSTASHNVELDGSGDVTVWAVDALDVSISASGNVEYYGDLSVTNNITGSGNLTSLGEKSEFELKSLNERK